MQQQVKKSADVWPVDIERKTMVYAVLAIALFILVSLVEIPFSMTMTSEEVQSLYRMLEFFSIMVAISIAFQGWMLFPVTMSRHRLLIGALFLVVGVLDLQHTINYQGLSFLEAKAPFRKRRGVGFCPVSFVQSLSSSFYRPRTRRSAYIKESPYSAS